MGWLEFPVGVTDEEIDGTLDRCALNTERSGYYVEDEDWKQDPRTRWLAGMLFLAEKGGAGEQTREGD